MDDAILMQCNETELLALARRQGLGRLRRGLPREVLVQIVGGHIEPTQQHYAGTVETRARLQKLIWDNIKVTRSQLPGCDGRCTTYHCTEGRHAGCMGVNEDVIT